MANIGKTITNVAKKTIFAPTKAIAKTSASIVKNVASEFVPSPTKITKGLKEDLTRFGTSKTPSLKSSSFKNSNVNKDVKRIMNRNATDIRELKFQVNSLGQYLINIDDRVTAIQEDTKTLAKMQTIIMRDANRNFSLIQKQLEKLDRQNLELRQVAMFEKYNKQRTDILSKIGNQKTKSTTSAEGKQDSSFGMFDWLKIAGGVAGAAALGYAGKKTYDRVSELNETTRAAASAAVRVTRRLTPDIIRKSIAKIIAPSLAKLGAKKIPVIGAILGAASATYRLYEGDKVGAGMEALSGGMSFFPGASLTAGLGLDITIIARDVYKDIVGTYPDGSPDSNNNFKLIVNEVKIFLTGEYEREQKKQKKEFIKDPSELTTDKAVLKILEYWKSNPELAGKKGPEKTNPLDLGKATRLYYDNTKNVAKPRGFSPTTKSMSSTHSITEDTRWKTNNGVSNREVVTVTGTDKLTISTKTLKNVENIIDKMTSKQNGKTEIKDKELILSSDSPHTIILDSETILFKKQGVKLTKNGFESIAGGKTPEWAKKVFDESYTEPKKTFGRRNYRTSGRSFVDYYNDQKIIDSKQDFLAYGKLPKGFEFLPGHMGTLGSPGAVMARGAMPYSGGGYSGGGGGGYSGGGGGGYSGGGGGGYSGGGGGGGYSGDVNNTSVTRQASIPNQNNNQSFSWGDVGKSSIKSGGASFGPLKVDSRGNVDPRSYYESALKQLEGSKLIGFIPKDGERFGIKKGTKEEWAKFMVQLTKQESSFNVNTVGDSGNSIGLSQMKAGEYGIRDPRDPLQAQKGMIKQFEKYILPFGAITGRGSGKGTYAGWGGASAYFGPLRGDSRIAAEFNKPGNLQFMKKISPELEKLGEGLPALSLPPRELLGGQTQQETQSLNQRTDARVPKFFENGVPNVRQRAEIFKQGGVVVNLDTNWDERKNVQTGPLVVIPDNATKEQREAAEKYVKSIEASYAEKFGKSIKGQVKTRSQNKRGLGNTIHTEPFSVNDSKAVEYFTQTKEGRAALAKATQYLGDIPGAVISEPHNRFKKSPDLGAVSRYSIDPQTGKKVNEVGIARQLIGDLKSIYSQPVTENSERMSSQSISMRPLSTNRIGMEPTSVSMAFPMTQEVAPKTQQKNYQNVSGVHPLQDEKYRITSRFGPRRSPTSGASSNHKGVDYGVAMGTSIKSIMDGKVTFAGTQRGYGYIVEIEHENGIKSRYAHLSEFKVKEGDVIKKGQVLALSGGAKGHPGAGTSTGPHLHFEIIQNGQKINPLPFLESFAPVNEVPRPSTQDIDMKMPSTSTILSNINEIERIKRIDEGIPVDKIDYSKEEERLKSIDETTATREDISTYKTTVPSVQQDLPQPSGEITKEPGAIKPYQPIDATKISAQGINMFAERSSIPGIPSPEGIAATDAARGAFSPRPIEFEPPVGMPYPSYIPPETPEQAVPQPSTEGPAIAGAGMTTADSVDQLNKKLDAAAETPVTTSTKPGGGDSGERSGAAAPSNLGGGNHPESSASSPGSGGYGSYGRCFV